MLFVALCLLPVACVAHVSLTFPPARFPPLDFLDTARTIKPCGVPKPPSGGRPWARDFSVNYDFDAAQFTELYVGEPYNITWRLQNLHQGGYRLSLIDENGKTVETLAPVDSDGFVGSDDQTAQRQDGVVLTKPCRHCSILLERQATEYGKSYQFHSCADVDVLEASEPRDDEHKCSMNGKFENGQCVCKPRFSGDLCQYKDDCSTDSDCLNGGKCVFEPTALVRNTCFCAFGFFGKNCDTTFEGKPEGDACFNYDYPANEANFDKYGLFSERCFRKNTLKNNDTVYSRVVGDEVEIILDYEGTTWIGLGWRPEGIDRSCRLFPDLENARRAKRTPAEPSPANDEDEPLEPVPMPQLPDNNGYLERELLAPLHPMDCTDIVIGSVKEGRSRINDMYTRDRSTPLVDTLIDGEESFSAAYGIEQDGRTVIMFRRRVAEIEPSDHPLGPGQLFVIWAKGQTNEALDAIPKSPNGTEQYKDHEFFRMDQVKYHGYQNRGVSPMEFVKKDELQTTTRPPLRRKTTTVSPVPEPATSAEPAPNPEPAPEPSAEPLPEPSSAPEPGPTTAPEPEPTSAPEPTAEPEPAAEPGPSPNLLAVPEPPAATAEPAPEPTSEPEPGPVSTNELDEAEDSEPKKAKYDPSAYLNSSAMRLVAISGVMFVPLIYLF